MTNPANKIQGLNQSDNMSLAIQMTEIHTVLSHILDSPDPT